MELADLLPQEHVVVPLRATTARGALTELVDHLRERGTLGEGTLPGGFPASLGNRAVVPIGPRVILPHYRTDAVQQLVVALGISSRPLDGRDMALETTPRIVVLILAPPEAATLYLQTVAALARVLRDPAVVQRLVEARTPDEVRALPELVGLKIQPALAVRDLMIQATRSVAPDAPVADAVGVMVQQRVRALPVVGEKREVLGIVTERDIMRALLPQIPRASAEAGAEKGSSPLRVRDIMTRSVLCISEDMGLEEAANMMINKDVEQFPVVSEGKLTGLLTRGELIRKLFGR